MLDKVKFICNEICCFEEKKMIVLGQLGGYSTCSVILQKHLYMYLLIKCILKCFFYVRINTIIYEPDYKGMSGVRYRFRIKPYDSLAIFGDISIKVTEVVNLKSQGLTREKCIFSILYYYNVKTFMNIYNSLIKFLL